MIDSLGDLRPVKLILLKFLFLYSESSVEECHENKQKILNFQLSYYKITCLSYFLSSYDLTL